MNMPRRSLSYVDRDDCVRVADQMHEHLDEDMSDEEFRTLIEEMRLRKDNRLLQTPSPLGRI